MSKFITTSANQVARYLGAVLEGADLLISGVSPISYIENNTVIFSSKKIIEIDNKSSLLLCKKDATVKSNSLTVLRVDNPRHAFAKVTKFLSNTNDEPIIHPTALISPLADIQPNVSIGAFSIIRAKVRIGCNTIIDSHVDIREYTIIGDDCLIKTGAVIGHQGYGFGFSSDRTPERIVHTGGVDIGNRVEVGANTVICSGTMQPTIIQNDVKIDDLVFIAHNCNIGAKTMVVAGAEISGSVTIGERCWVGPNSSIIDGTLIGDDVLLGIGSIITKNVPNGKKMMGLNSLDLRSLQQLKKRIEFGK